MTVFITVFGIVQGVGYRPFVAGLAKEAGVSGFVRNSAGIVEICASGDQKSVDGFVGLLRTRHPENAWVMQIKTEEIESRLFDGFSIVESDRKARKPETPVFPPDLPICENCRREMNNPSDRRYRYPFISCASCGPRYSILESLPYDRETTSMRDFRMCEECAGEYRSGRRRHAQTISCRDCGPQLFFAGAEGCCEKDEALKKGAEFLKKGKILAIKGIGGYQFVCSPFHEETVSRLRTLKGREKKPFAVMFSSCEKIRKACRMDADEEELLTSAAKPIVLLKKKADLFCPGVCGESRFIGAFLPNTGLHQILTDECGPLIVTSGNITSEPIIFDDETMLRIDSPLLGGVLYNARRILTPQDDSVTRVFRGTEQILRRSRGYVPLPILIGAAARRPVLAAGGDLKSSFCLLSDDRAYVSQYFGDLKNYKASGNYRDALLRMERIFGIEPETVVCDLHPGYLSAAMAAKIASGTPQKKIIKVQHHHAHAASVMAEHELNGGIGVVFDGTGYGTDGAVWGGEFLLCRGARFERKGHLSYVTLCGADTAAENAGLTADCYRVAAGEQAGGERFPVISAAIAHRVNTFRSSSAGRLFDAAAAIFGIRAENTYEGECPIALENAAAAALRNGKGPTPFHFSLNRGGDGCLEADQADFARQMLRAVKNGEDPESAALGFHTALADLVLEVCRKIRNDNGEDRVALSGGVFANLLLLEGCCARLKKDGFKVYWNSAVPSNDGGICLGQAWIAAVLANGSLLERNEG